MGEQSHLVSTERELSTGIIAAETTMWPDGKSFAFTIIDDPDGQHLREGRIVYSFLADLGFRTTKAVWPLGPIRATNSPGDTCAEPEYRKDATDLQTRGFEIAFHNATAHSSTRDETNQALNAFRDYFGHDPRVMANHYNEEAIYWGPARLSGGTRAIYNVLTLGRKRNRYFGHVEGHKAFWGDFCRERIVYCRNLVFSQINTLAVCPWIPYFDPSRHYVKAWFAAAEGSNLQRFVRTISEANQDRLEAEGGACIMYVHFGHGFVDNSELNTRFRELMRRLSQKNGWFVPVGTLLDYLRQQKKDSTISRKDLASLERRWLWEKWRHGTS